MGRPRKFANDAIKQRTYRLQRKIRDEGEESVHYARLERLHAVVRRAASQGDEGAKKLLGKNAPDTALKIILSTQPEPGEDMEDYMPTDLIGFDIAYHAYEEAASDILLKRSEMKHGVFQVVIGTEARAPRRRESTADRPSAQGQSRERPKSTSSRAAPKGREKVAPAAAKEQS
jgi:hypothetical protein